MYLVSIYRFCSRHRLNGLRNQTETPAFAKPRPLYFFIFPTCLLISRPLRMPSPPRPLVVSVFVIVVLFLLLTALKYLLTSSRAAEIVNKTAAYVARVGVAFESELKIKHGANKKFSFLTPESPFHAYYRHKIEVRSTDHVVFQFFVHFFALGINVKVNIRCWACSIDIFTARKEIMKGAVWTFFFLIAP